MKFNITIESIQDSHITRMKAVDLDWLESWLKTKKHSFEFNQKQGTKSTGKFKAKKQVKQNLEK